MFMQAGFAMVETGLTVQKTLHYMLELNDIPLGMLGFWVCGFAIMFGVRCNNYNGGFDGLNHELTISCRTFIWSARFKRFFLAELMMLQYLHVPFPDGFMDTQLLSDRC